MKKKNTRAIDLLRIPLPPKGEQVIIPKNVFKRKRDKDRLCKEIKEYIINL